MTRPITLVLLGDIAAGKGTQARILAKKFGLKLVDTGGFSRKVLVGKSKVGKRLERIKLGKLAPSDIIQGFLKSQIRGFKSHQGVLIDGGKMPGEARLIHELFTKQGRKVLVIYLSIPRQEIFQRLKWRYYCAATGKPLVVKNNVKKCPHCGGKLIKRADDDPEAIRSRLDYYEKIYRRTVEFWQEKGLLRKINGKQSIDKVTRDIVKVIKDYYS